MEPNNAISTHTAAHNVQEYLKSNGYDQFILRPWNRFEPEDSLWWLVPTTEWPAYKHGKIVIYKNLAKDYFFVGIHLEKGYSAEAAKFSPYSKPERLVTRPDWIWSKALADIKSGTFSAKLNAIARGFDAPLRVFMYATAVNDKDPDMVKIPGLDALDSLLFTYQDGALKCISDDVKDRMREYMQIDAIERLPEVLEAKDMAWYWIDLHVVFKVPCADHDKLGDFAKAFVENYRELF